MASAKANKRMVSGMDLPECPVCLENMSPPIFLCQSGHSVCHTCNDNLRTPHCPVCREEMTKMRNWQLEDMYYKKFLPAHLKDNCTTEKPDKKEADSASSGSASTVPDNMVKVTCPNRSIGCTYKMPKIGLDFHLKECPFRDIDCPHGAVFGGCFWRGKLKEIMEHFKYHHNNHCNVRSDTDIYLENIDFKHNNRYLYLVAQNQLLFVITVKIDVLKKTAFWTVQHIGRKADAKQHVYEINLTSLIDSRRTLIFTHHCFNDLIKADEVFCQAKCTVVPFFVLKNFIKDKKLTFKFCINKLPSTSEK